MRARYCQYDRRNARPQSSLRRAGGKYRREIVEEVVSQSARLSTEKPLINPYVFSSFVALREGHPRSVQVRLIEASSLARRRVVR
jgi:hypothetical protein